VNQTILVTNPGASPPGWTLIDAKTFKILGRATLGAGVPTGSIEQPKFDPLLGKFVSSVGQLSSHDTHGALAVVDTQVAPHSHTVHATAFRLSVGCNPLGLAIGAGRDLFVSCFNGPSVIVTAKQGGSGFQTDGQFPQACCSDEAWYDPHLGRYYAASFLNPRGTGKDPVVTVVDAKNESFIANIPIFTTNLAPAGNVAPQPDMSFHTVAVDPVTGYVYVPAATGVRVFAATTGATVPSAHTGEPWSGWLYWMLAAGTAALGYGIFEVGRRRGKARRAA
jgi:hypothetical protein